MSYLHQGEKKTQNPLGLLVRSSRHDRKLSLALFAKEVGVTRARLSQIELGRAKMNKSYRTLKRLAALCDVDLDLLKELVIQATHRGTVGWLVQMRRLELGLSQREVAIKIGVSTSTITCIEKNANRRLTLPVLKKVENFLGSEIPREYVVLAKKRGPKPHTEHGRF